MLLVPLLQRRDIGRLIDPLVIRREARKEMPANAAARKENLEVAASLRQ